MLTALNESVFMYQTGTVESLLNLKYWSIGLVIVPLVLLTVVVVVLVRPTVQHEARSLACYVVFVSQSNVVIFFGTVQVLIVEENKLQVLRLFLDIPVHFLESRFVFAVSALDHIAASNTYSNTIYISFEQVPLVRVFRARIGRRIAATESSSDGAMGAGNSMGGSGGELQSTGMEEEEEALVIDNVCNIVDVFYQYLYSIRTIRNEGLIRFMIHHIRDTVQVLRQIKAENDPQGTVLQQVVLGSTGADHNAADGASSSSSKGSQRTKDKEQRHRLAKINSAGDNADFLRRNLTMLKISSYVLFGAHRLEYFLSLLLFFCCSSDCCCACCHALVFLCNQRFCTSSSPTKYFLAIKRLRCFPSRIKSTGPRIAPCRCV